MNKEVERTINKIFNAVYKQVFNTKNVKELANGNNEPILDRIAKFQSSQKYFEFANRFSKELAKKGIKKQRGLWRKYYEVAKKSGYTTIPGSYNEYEKLCMENAIKHNFTMISSIPQQMRKILEHKYINTLVEEVAKGNLPRGSFKKELDKHGVKNAKLIARTETAKLQASITQQRATDLGSVAYIWIASMDKRTRPSHKAMDNVVVFYRPDSQKPLLDNMRGNAGEFPNCRCYGEPIFDEDDLKSAMYKVYDYRTDKIITMNRKELIDALKNKQLK